MMPMVFPSGRRVFSNDEKREFVRLYREAAPVRGERTRLMRQWRLDKQMVKRWIATVEQVTVDPGALPKAPRKVTMNGPDRARLAQLEQENTRLRRQLDQAEAVMEIMGKAHELLQQAMIPPEPQAQIPIALMSQQEYQDWLSKYKLS